MIRSLLIALLCAGIALVTSTILIPILVHISYKKKILDAPNYRKLQQHPVPILGGMSIYLSMVLGTFVGNYFYPMSGCFVILAGITLMFYVGLVDDIISLKPRTKFFFQFLVIIMFCSQGIMLDNLEGVFGCHQLPPYLAWLLSIVAGVGLINALNLIDGVDGLASSQGIFSCTLAGIFFVRHGDPQYALIATVFCGGLLTFFCCNVFSRKYKMFIGDSGSLILGTLAYLFCCRIMDDHNYYPLDNYLISMLLTVYCVPVFDTLRVMLTRIRHGKSPFSPDKGHLHHIFVALDIPHFIITFIILSMSFGIFVINYLLSLFLWTPTLHLIVTAVIDAIIVCGVYIVLRHIQLYKKEQFLKMKHHIRERITVPLKIYHFIQHLVDHTMWISIKAIRRILK